MTKQNKVEENTTGSKLKNKRFPRDVLQDKKVIHDRLEDVGVRLLTVFDLLALHRMYRSLSEESRNFFRPIFFEKKSVRWLVANIALIFSTFTSLKILLKRLFPRAIVIPLIATNDRNDIVAFAYLNIEKRLAKEKYLAGFATCVIDDYQGRGLGRKLMGVAIEMAQREKIVELSLWVVAENRRAIMLYEKAGFRVIRLVKRKNRCSRSYDYLKMILHLS
jgi:GNAT superfamily N-acetyltransferase